MLFRSVIERNGEAIQTLDFDQRGIHTIGHNKNSIGVCLAGGAADHADLAAPHDKQIWEFNYNDSQLETLGEIITDFVDAFPSGIVKGHSALQDQRSCPGFIPWLWYQTEYIA